MVPRPAGAFQSAAAHRIRAPPAHRHRQDPQERTSRPSAPDTGCTMTPENITSTRQGATAIVTLNRPQRRNALSLALMRELIACLDEIARDRETRAVVLAAAGKVFCSGHDLGEMTGRDIRDY